MNFPRARLLQFARYPQLGKVKTRLHRALPAQTVYRLHCQLVRYTNELLVDSALAPVDVWYGSDSVVPGDDPFLCSLSSDATFHQIAGSLGDKMHHAFYSTLKPAGSADCALLVGSDCPFINKSILEDALTALADGVDVVLGPAEDGGYYLIGLKCTDPAFFEGVRWGTASVLEETVQRIDKMDLSRHSLIKLGDIDTPEDLPKLAEKPEFDWLKI